MKKILSVLCILLMLCTYVSAGVNEPQALIGGENAEDKYLSMKELTDNTKKALLSERIRSTEGVEPEKLSGAAFNQESVSVDGQTIEKVLIRWLTPSSGETESAGYSRLDLIASDNNTIANQQFQIDIALSGQFDYRPGEVELVFPAYLWLDREMKEPSVLTLGIPEEPDLTQDFAWRRVEDKIIITNVHSIPAGTKFMIQGTFRDMDPSRMVDRDTLLEDCPYAGYSDDLYAYLTIVSPKGNTASLESNHISASYDTSVRVASSVKTAHNPSGEKYEEYVYDQVPDHMPRDLVPQEPEKYMYIRWYVSGSAAGSQPYDMTICEDLREDVWDGIILGFEQNGKVTKVFGKTAEYLLAENCSDFGISKSAYVWTAYPRENFVSQNEASSKIENTQITRVKGIDDGILSEMSSSDIADYRIPITYTWNKIWDDEEDLHQVRPDRVVLKIFRQAPDETEWDMKHPWKTVNVTKDTGWSYVWSDEGIPFTYRVQENLVNASGVYRSEYDAHGNARYLKWDYVLADTDYDLITHTWNYVNRYTEGWVEFEVSKLEKTVNAPAYREKDRKSTLDNALNLLKKGKSVLVDYQVTTSISVAEDTVWYGRKPMKVMLLDGQYAFGNTLLSEEDIEVKYVRIPEVTTYAYTDLNEETGKYKKTLSEENKEVSVYGLFGEDWIRYAVYREKDPSHIQTENGAFVSGDLLYFPEGVFQIKAEKETEEAVVEISLDIGLLLKSSERVTERVLSEFRTTDYGMLKLENKARMSAEWQKETTVYMEEAAAAFLHGRNYRIAAELDGYMTYEENDTASRRILLNTSLTLRQQSNVMNLAEYRQAKEDALASTKEGIFYDLIPEGMTVDTDTITLEKGRVTHVQLIPDYKGSGRELLVVYAELDTDAAFMKDRDSDVSNPHYKDESYPKAGCFEEHTLSFKMVYPWDEASERGFEHIRNYAAYEASEPVFGDIAGWSGECDDVSGNNHQETRIMTEGAEDYLTDLDPDRDDPVFVYAASSVTMPEIDLSALVSVSKSVQVEGSGRWTLGTSGDANVYEGQSYTYRLQLVNDHETISRNVILLDSLESYIPKETDADHGDRRWQGIFTGIDLSQIESLGIAPKVYYYTGDSPDISGYNPGQESHVVRSKLESDPGWTETLPEDPGMVKAIAIDCSKDKEGRDYELKEDGILQTYIHMKAPFLSEDSEVWQGDPSDASDNGHAYNHVFLDVDQKTNGQTTHGYIHFDYTKVGIRCGSVHFRKVWDDMDDNDGIRPSSLEIRLFLNGKDSGRSLELSEPWEGTFDHVQLFDEKGKAVKVELKETVPEGYESKVMRVKDGVYVLTNIHEPERISIPFIKEWVGDEMPDGTLKRPDSVTVYLDADGVYTGKSLRVIKSTNYRGSFNDLLKYKDKKEINYQLREAPVEGFYPSYEEGKIINTYCPYGDLVVYKEVAKGTEAAKERIFSFVIEFYTEDGQEVTENFFYETSDGREGRISNGSEFSLRSGENIRIRDIPLKTAYRITERKQEGFTLTESENTEGMIKLSHQDVQARFLNTYSSAGTLFVSVEKILEGRDLRPYQFSFYLKDTEGNILRTAYVKANGTAEFSPLRFTEEDDGKEFTYQICEAPKQMEGYTPDEQVYTLKAVPLDNGDGTMSVMSHIYKESGEETDKILFTNRYHAEAEVRLKAWKILKGRDILSGEFSFELTDEKGEILDTKTCMEDGTITFDPLRFDEKDAGKTYYYFVREKNDGAEEVVYDPSRFCYGIRIEDNGDGTLSLIQTMYDAEDLTKESDELPVFRNALKPGSLSVGKALWNSEGADQDQLFTFKVVFTGEEMENATVPYERYLYEMPEDIREKLENGELTGNSSDIKPVQGIQKKAILSKSPVKVRSADLSGYPGEDATITHSGTFGTCIWEIWSDGTLLIYPENGTEGQLGNTTAKDQSSYIQSSAPWYDYYTEVLRVAVRPGVKTGTSCAGLFARLYKVTDYDLRYLDTREAVNMSYMFAMPELSSERPVLKSLDLSSFNTANVTNMKEMFDHNYNLLEVDLSSFDTSKVTSMESMFESCVMLPSVDLSSFRTPNVTTLRKMFYYCNNLKEADLSTFDTSQVTTLYAMFYNNYKIKKIDVSSFDTGNVTDMRFMFLGCKLLTDLDVSHFKTEKVTKMNCMFDNCRSLKYLDLSGFNTANLTDTFKMFWQCCSLEYLNISSFDMSKVTRSDYMLEINSDSGSRGNLKTLVLGDKCILTKTRLTDITQMDIYNSSVHTGKWVLEDNEDMALTSQELMDLYDGYSSLSGTWVPETWPTTYKLSFEAGESGASGSMASVRCEASEDAVITNGFTCFSSVFKGFTDGVNTFSSEDGFSVTIPGNTYAIGDKITLYPIFEPETYEADLSNGTITLTLHGNEQVVFPELPCGISYHVFEETPDGWQLIYKEADSGTIESMKKKQAVFVNTYIPGQTSITFRGLKLMDGVPASSGQFSFELLEDDILKETVQTDEKGEINFSEILYTSSGIHHYRIREKDPEDPAVLWDTHEETVTVTISDDGKGNLIRQVEGNPTPVFQNFSSPGKLLIRKEAEGLTEANRDALFTVRASLTYANGQPFTGDVLIGPEKESEVTGPEEKRQVSSGKLDLNLKAGESILIRDLPAGLQFGISEEDLSPGWKIKSIRPEADIIKAGETSEVVVTNRYEASASVTLKAYKKLEGAVLESGRFRFRLIKDHEVLDEKTNAYPDLSEFIMDDQGNLIPNPHFGMDVVNFDTLAFTEEGIYTYIIREVDTEEQDIEYDLHDERIQILVKDTGLGYLRTEIQTDEDGPVFINRTAFMTLSVTKKVEGSMGDRGKDFHFRLEVSKDGEKNLSEIRYKKKTRDGKEEAGVLAEPFEFTLEHDETMEFFGIPRGSSYEVREEEADQDGYRTHSSESFGVLEKDTACLFVNTREGAVPAGVSLRWKEVWFLTVPAILLILYVFFRKNRRRKLTR